jgi:thioredoxin reductase (NADPH)
MEVDINSSTSTTNRRHQVVILGNGPCGLTAALYAARAGLKPLVLSGDTPGGQLTTTGKVENFPGFPEGIDGFLLIENMEKQAKSFGAIFESGLITKLEPGRPFKLHKYNSDVIEADAVIVATGAGPRKLGLPSETKWWSKGVTSCAVCDGYFYKGKEVCVIGGGDSAMEEATFLTNFCPKVYIIHRRDKFRASKIMLDRAMKNDKIEIIYNAVVEEILGDESRQGGLKVNGVRIQDVTSGQSRVLPIEGVFLAIGHIPNTSFLQGVIPLDQEGYAITKPGRTATDVEGLYVAGDAQDHVFRQAITAAGTGCMAAIEAERW